MHVSWAEISKSLEQNKNNYHMIGGSLYRLRALAPHQMRNERENNMRAIMMTVAATGFSAAALIPVGSTIAQAGTVCLTDKEVSTNYQSCEFYSFRECRASQAGVGGTCVLNPYPDEGGAGPLLFGPPVPYGSAYNRYLGPLPGGGYVRPYGY